ncbi:MAG: Flp pilus assembly protein CpaB [Planctomycetota bacterium]
MNLKIWLPLILAVVLGLVAAFMALNLASAPAAAPEVEAPQYADIVVTVRPIPAGTRITPDALRVSRVEIENVAPGAFADPSEVAKRIALVSYGEGQTVLADQTADPESPAGIAALLSPGTRAVVVKIDDEIAKSGVLMPESRVDVVGTVFGSGELPDISRTFVKDVKVIAIGRQTSRHLAENGEGTEPQELQTPTATLEVTTEEAQVLELAFRSAKARLVLRPMNDGEPIEIPAFTLNDLRGQSDFGDELGFAGVGADNDPFAERDFDAQGDADMFADVAPEPKTRQITVIRGGVETRITVPVREKKADAETEATPAAGEVEPVTPKTPGSFWTWMWNNEERDEQTPVIAGDHTGFEELTD